MTKRLISFLIALWIFIAIPLSARYKYNPFTRKLDYYEPVSGSDLGDLGDVTLTGLATGNVLYYNGTAWVNLAVGANGEYLSVVAGIPAWSAIAVPNFLALSDTPSAYTGKAGQLVRVNAVPDGLEFFAGSAAGTVIVADGSGGWTKDESFNIVSGKVSAGGYEGTAIANLYIAGIDQNLLQASSPTFNDLTISTPSNIYGLSHNSFTDYDSNDHIDHTAVSVLSGGLISGGGTIAGNQTLTLTEATIESNIDTLPNLTSIQGQTVTFSGSLNVEANSNINQDVTSDGTPTFGGLIVTDIFSYDYTTDHNLLVGYLAGQDLTSGQGQYNTLLGEEAGADITTGDYNIILGYMAGRKITTNVSNILIGRNIASVSVSQAHSNVIIGDLAAIELTNGYENVILGKEAARDIKSAGLNVIIGWQASLEHESGNDNVVIGSQAGVGVAGSSNYGFNTIVGANAGQYILTAGANNVLIGYQAAQDITSGASNIVIGYMAGEGWLDTESEKLVIDVTDTTNPLIYGDFSADNITINGDFNVTMDAALDQVVISQSSEDGTEGQALVKIVDDREGATTDEPSESSLVILPGGNNAFYVASGASTFGGDLVANDDVLFTWGSSSNKAVIAQSSVTGTEDQPLIFINDDRTGATANETSEATIYMDVEGVYAIYVEDGQTNLQSTYMYANSGLKADDALWSYGGGDDILIKWDLNGVADDLLTFSTNTASAASTAALFYSEWPLNPLGMTDHDDYLSPTFIIVNWEAADANDYAGVVIGERAQANVAIAHYFDFYAMTGSIDGSQDENITELAAIFRFGNSGSATTDHSLTAGGVLFEDDIEIDGDIHVDGDSMTFYDPIGGDTTFIIDWAGDNYPRFGTSGVNLNMLGTLVIGAGNLNVSGADRQMNVANFLIRNDINGVGDTIVLAQPTQSATVSPVWFMIAGVGNPNGMTDHDDYLSATLVVVNDEGADANDYAGVVIGERAQASVLVAHYFDFYAMAGAIDGTPDVNAAELAAIFRFGASGTATPDNATTPGDVLFEGAIEADGTIYADGGIVHVVSQEVNFNDETPVSIATVADGYMVTCVIVEITTTWDGNGTIVVGDGNDPDGYLEDGNITQGAAAYYGWHHDERGAYLWHSAGGGTGHDDCVIYTGADTIDATLVAGTSSQGVATVFVHMIRLK